MSLRLSATFTALLMLLAFSPAQADDIIFNDLTSTLSVTHIGNNHVVTDSFGNLDTSLNYTPCSGELCSIVVFGTSTPPDFGSGVLLAIQEPSSNLISDVVIGTNPNFPDTYTLTFASYDPAVLSCPAYGCFIVEDGTVQTLYTVAWGDSSTDTIKFQSAVPEPSSLLLFGSGLTGLVAVLRRRLPLSGRRFRG